MKFEPFDDNFPRDPGPRAAIDTVRSVPDLWALRELFQEYGGSSFRRGLYRIIRAAEFYEWQDRISFAFPALEKRIACFGFDWLGRAFALDSNRTEDGQYGVVMFEPGTGEALEIPSNLETFHTDGLIKFGEAALAISFFQKWLNSGGLPPSYSECVGYKKPLFLSGIDEVENLELSNIDVYWQVAGQLIRRAKGLPIGSRVNVKIKRN